MTDTGKPTIFEALASVMGDVREVRDISLGVASGMFTTRSSRSSVRR